MKTILFGIFLGVGTLSIGIILAAFTLIPEFLFGH